MNRRPALRSGSAIRTTNAKFMAFVNCAPFDSCSRSTVPYLFIKTSAVIVRGVQAATMRYFSIGKSVPSMNRTCNPFLRTEVLYPIELWGHKNDCDYNGIPGEQKLIILNETKNVVGLQFVAAFQKRKLDHKPDLNHFSPAFFHKFCRGLGRAAGCE